jgi:phosphatidylglycerophosphatase A
MKTTKTPWAPKTSWAWTAGTFFGIGLIKPGPGTWASLATVLIWFFAARAAHLSFTELAIATAAVALSVTLVGIPAGTIVANESGREDPGHVVIDEVAGQLVPLIVCPIEGFHLLLAFALFRLFDILKPWPANQLEQLHGGTGIMLDDIAAGFYALMVMVVVEHWW